MEYIIEQQYSLTRYANISVIESENMSEIDRNAYYAILIKDEKEQGKIK